MYGYDIVCINIVRRRGSDMTLCAKILGVYMYFSVMSITQLSCWNATWVFNGSLSAQTALPEITVFYVSRVTKKGGCLITFVPLFGEGVYTRYKG